MFDKLLQLIVDRYSGPKNLYCPGKTPPADVIVILSYATFPDLLTNGTKETTRKGSRVRRYSRKGIVAFGNAEYIFPGAASTERRYKKRILKRFGVPNSKILDVGIIENSFQEAACTRDALAKARIKAKRICLVAGRMHKPSAYAIWKYYFPEAEISVATIPHQYEYQPNHPVLVQRGAWRCLAANMARHCGFLAAMYCEKHLPFIPLTPATLARFHHRVSLKR